LPFQPKSGLDSKANAEEFRFKLSQHQYYTHILQRSTADAVNDIWRRLSFFGVLNSSEENTCTQMKLSYIKQKIKLEREEREQEHKEMTQMLEQLQRQNS